MRKLFSFVWIFFYKNILSAHFDTYLLIRSLFFFFFKKKGKEKSQFSYVTRAGQSLEATCEVTQPQFSACPSRPTPSRLLVDLARVSHHRRRRESSDRPPLERLLLLLAWTCRSHRCSAPRRRARPCLDAIAGAGALEAEPRAGGRAEAVVETTKVRSEKAATRRGSAWCLLVVEVKIEVDGGG